MILQNAAINDMETLASDQQNKYMEAIATLSCIICLVMKLGGRCVTCGYARNLAALDFHHREPQSKTFQLDTRTLANRNWRDVEIEAEKCLLLCSNCHAEHHNPGAFIDQA